MSDNGKDLPPQEETLEQKVERFKANPDNWVCLDDLILGAIKIKEGVIGTRIGSFTRGEIETACIRLQFKAFQIFQAIEMAEYQKHNKIIHPGNNKGGIMGFVRGGKKN